MIQPVGLDDTHTSIEDASGIADNIDTCPVLAIAAGRPIGEGDPVAGQVVPIGVGAMGCFLDHPVSPTRFASMG
jgi:hypothetical protein